MNKTTIVDVREELRAGRHPLPQIMAAAAALPAGGRLRVVAIFEPVPLIHMFRSRGFGHQSRQLGPEHWEIEFGRDLPADGPLAAASCCGVAETIDVDARGLEPPEPMVRVLSALEGLAPGGSIRALTDRRPMHLLDALAQRGCAAESREMPSGGWETMVRKGCGS